MSNVNSVSSLQSWTRISQSARKYTRKATKAMMRSHHVHIPKYDMPIRIRPWFLALTFLVMLILAFLGFTNFAHSLPVNDKLLHFFCLMLATGIFYFIFDVEEDARRIWLWRTAPLLFTGFVCLFFGGIMSEFVQSMLPYKEFQFGDIVANLLGSSIGLYIAYHVERYYRHRREISQLYRPLGTDPESEDEEDIEAGTQLLPVHIGADVRTSNKTVAKSSRLADVWDEGEELFDIGGDSDDEGEHAPGAARGPPMPSPKIVVTSSA